MSDATVDSYFVSCFKPSWALMQAEAKLEEPLPLTLSRLNLFSCSKAQLQRYSSLPMNSGVARISPAVSAKIVVKSYYYEIIEVHFLRLNATKL